VNVPIDDADRFVTLYEVISDVFEQLGFIMFQYGALKWLIVLVLTIAVARFVWSLVKGLF